MHPHLARQMAQGARHAAEVTKRPHLALRLLLEGYDALPRLREEADDPDAFPVSLLGRPALVVRGAEGARLFYDESLVRRSDAMPPPLAGLLFGDGAVHRLDGETHRTRKELFLEVLEREQVDMLARRVSAGLSLAAMAWAKRVRFSLFDELVEVYGSAALDWAGTGTAGREAALVSHELASIVDGFGFGAAAYPRAWLGRLRVDRWARRVLSSARAGQLSPRPGSAVEVLASGSGRDLPLDVAAVELVNVVRPTVAVAWLGAFAGLMLAEHPEQGPLVCGPDGAAHAEGFVHEVRRLSPFVPALAARVQTTWTHRGHPIRPGHRVVLDVPGTNRHPDVWADPDTFRPERFLSWRPGPFEYVPQGGGELSGHRCPGEGVAQELLRATVCTLASSAFTFDRSPVHLQRIPTLPAGGLVLSAFRRLDAA